MPEAQPPQPMRSDFSGRERGLLLTLSSGPTCEKPQVQRVWRALAQSWLFPQQQGWVSCPTAPRQVRKALKGNTSSRLKAPARQTTPQVTSGPPPPRPHKTATVAAGEQTASLPPRGICPTDSAGFLKGSQGGAPRARLYCRRAPRSRARTSAAAERTEPAAPSPARARTGAATNRSGRKFRLT